MKKVGDSIHWNTKSGTATGVIESVRFKARYIAKIDGSDKYMDLIEDVELSELHSGDPNIEFVETVRQMRNAQSRYFDTRDKSDLEKSRALERKVDAIIEIYSTPRLFDSL